MHMDITFGNNKLSRISLFSWPIQYKACVALKLNAWGTITAHLPESHGPRPGRCVALCSMSTRSLPLPWYSVQLRQNALNVIFKNKRAYQF